MQAGTEETREAAISASWRLWQLRDPICHIIKERAYTKVYEHTQTRIYTLIPLGQHMHPANAAAPTEMLTVVFK